MAVNNQTEGFGYNKVESAHHFRVTIPSKKTEFVVISEHLTDDESPEQQKLGIALGQVDNKARVILKYAAWIAIADAVRVEFNLRLRRASIKTGQWKIPGETPLARTYGKELVLLAWAIEDAEPYLIPNAIRNWEGLQPEERWWLFTMTNAATGNSVSGRGKGWRKAVRYALTENPTGFDMTAPAPPGPDGGLWHTMAPELSIATNGNSSTNT